MPTKDEWYGQSFANNWIVGEKYNCAEYRAIYIKQTGDTTKQHKNSQYLCYNTICGVSTYMERSVILYAMKDQRNCMSKCKGCVNGNKKNNCWYSTPCREKVMSKIPDRTPQVKPGEIYGVWKINKVLSSTDFADHQTHAECVCELCGRPMIHRADTLKERTAVCDCFRNHSCGELYIKRYLDSTNLSYKSEYTFENLVGTGGNKLRYDFAILDFDGNVTHLIEFDGEQHYQEAGTYFNATGKVQIHDAIKDEWAKNHNIPLLRIPYWDLLKVEKLISDFVLQ